MITDKDLSKIQKMTETVMDVKLEPIKKELKTINKKLVQLHKDDEMIIKFLDGDLQDTKKRVDRIESHLHLPASPLQ